MTKSAKFDREPLPPGAGSPAWLDVLRGLNAEARRLGLPEPFGGTPEIGHKVEIYPNGGRVEFTGSTGNGTVVLSWGRDK